MCWERELGSKWKIKTFYNAEDILACILCEGENFCSVYSISGSLLFTKAKVLDSELEGMSRIYFYFVIVHTKSSAAKILNGQDT